MRPAGESHPGCVVIHHRNLDCLSRTVGLLLQEGIDPTDMIVVDNSGGEVSFAQLTEGVPHGVRIETIENQGYGNAANHGITLLLGRENPPGSILVATHEVTPHPNAIGMLGAALENDASLLAVGPTVVSSMEEGEGWTSSGGTRSHFLGIPQHAEPVDEAVVVPRVWLDGAFVLYRSSALKVNRFREEFFLYYEETELHYRLASQGGGVACVTGAVVEEVANDVPLALQGRNLQWLLDLHGTWWQRRVTVPWLIARTSLKTVLGRTERSDLKALIAGWRWSRKNPLPDHA